MVASDPETGAPPLLDQVVLAGKGTARDYAAVGGADAGFAIVDLDADRVAGAAQAA